MAEYLREALERNALMGKSTKDIARQLGFPDAEGDIPVGQLVADIAIAHFLKTGAPGLLNTVMNRTDGRVPPPTPETEPLPDPLTHDDQARENLEYLEFRRQREASARAASEGVGPSDGGNAVDVGP
jgi:hypothetical protein